MNSIITVSEGIYGSWNFSHFQVLLIKTVLMPSKGITLSNSNSKCFIGMKYIDTVLIAKAYT